MRARVFVTLRRGVLDPQGKAVGEALASLSYEGIQDVRQGKLFELTLTDRPLEQARAELERMCQQLLANTVIEDYSFEVFDDTAAQSHTNPQRSAGPESGQGERT